MFAVREEKIRHVWEKVIRDSGESEQNREKIKQNYLHCYNIISTKQFLKLPQWLLDQLRSYVIRIHTSAFSTQSCKTCSSVSLHLSLHKRLLLRLLLLMFCSRLLCTGLMVVDCFILPKDLPHASYSGLISLTCRGIMWSSTKRSMISCSNKGLAISHFDNGPTFLPILT